MDRQGKAHIRVAVEVVVLVKVAGHLDAVLLRHGDLGAQDRLLKNADDLELVVLALWFLGAEQVGLVALRHADGEGSAQDAFGLIQSPNLQEGVGDDGHARLAGLKGAAGEQLALADLIVGRGDELGLVLFLVAGELHPAGQDNDHRLDGVYMVQCLDAGHVLAGEGLQVEQWVLLALL